MTGRDQGKGKTEELWGREAVIQKATDSKGHKMGGKWHSLSHRIKSQKAMSEDGQLQTSSSSALVEDASISMTVDIEQ